MDIDINYLSISKTYTTTFTEKLGIIRFVSMCSIVWGHCLLNWESAHFTSSEFQYYQVFFLQLGKIGTINFFTITGFFMADKIQSFTVVGYLKHRFLPLILPWLIFLSFFVLIEFFKTITIHEILQSSFKSNIRIFLILTRSFIFNSAYWFIPMSLLSAIFLILFKRHISKVWFAVLVGGITLFYCINLYFGWLPASHTKAVLGYTVFIWLGLQLKMHLNLVKKIIIKIDWLPLIVAILTVFILTCIEGLHLSYLGSADSFASIRLSNCVLSMLLFLSLLKSEKINWMNYFNPRKYCFGIYLIHCIVIAQVSPIISRFIVEGDILNSLFYSLLLRFSFFVFVLLSSFLFVTLINKFGLKFILGSR